MRSFIKAQICLTVLLAAASSVSAKRLVVFGDSISDNGNGKRSQICAVRLSGKRILNIYHRSHQSLKLHAPNTELNPFASQAAHCMVTFLTDTPAGLPACTPVQEREMERWSNMAR